MLHVSYYDGGIIRQGPQVSTLATSVHEWAGCAYDFKHACFSAWHVGSG